VPGSRTQRCGDAMHSAHAHQCVLVNVHAPVALALGSRAGPGKAKNHLFVLQRLVIATYAIAMPGVTR
jgi:hypothetical protein